ncbi:MAG TPA: T9SS type A sorting domain-containing protein, partial [Candidatus Kapabacteria bacterium]|nr:T9SS type A sorting domain-containing protein [Candidatus Kapabacteria bacterium]
LDRGLRRVELLNFDNFVAMDPILVAGDKTLDVRIDLDNPAKSAFGRLQALDMWGSNSESPQVRDLHTAWVDVAIWVQPFQMKKSYLIEKTGEFVVPIKTIENDTFSLYRKGIRSMRFSFDITGDPQVTFVRAETDETMTAGWTINPMVQNNGRTVMIEAIAPAGSVLDGPSTMDVLRLVFVGAESDLTKSAEVSITPINGRFVEINRGAQDTVLGQYSNAILPAPQSEVNGFSVVVAGRCAPLVQAGDAKTSSIALHPIAPNPVSGSGRVRFEVGKDGPVSLRLYNSIGETVLSMVDGQITSGLYEQQFDVNGLASGSYYLRLESQGKVLTKVLKIAR